MSSTPNPAVKYSFQDTHSVDDIKRRIVMLRASVAATRKFVAKIDRKVSIKIRKLSKQLAKLVKDHGIAVARLEAKGLREEFKHKAGLKRLAKLDRKVSIKIRELPKQLAKLVKDHGIAVARLEAKELREEFKHKAGMKRLAKYKALLRLVEERSTRERAAGASVNPPAARGARE